MEITAFYCANCKKVSERKNPVCSSAKHHVEVLSDVIKRFFRCVNCNERTVSLGAVMPRYVVVLLLFMLELLYISILISKKKSEPCRKCAKEAFKQVSHANYYVFPCILFQFFYTDCVRIGKGQAETANLLPVLKLNHDTPDALLSSHASRRQQQFRDQSAADRLTKGAW